MAAKKRIDPIKQREKRVKIAAIAGCVLFLGIAALEVPKMLALMNKKPLTPGVATPVAVAGALPNVASGATTGGVTLAPGQLADTDLPPVATAQGQLVSFDVFETKNPFRPQVSDAGPPASAGVATTPSSSASGSTAAAGSAGSSSPAASTPATGPSTSGSGATTPSVSVVPSTSAPAATTPAATPSTSTPATTTTATAPSVSISVNGVVSRVGRDGTFPTGKPVFRLVSWVKGSAQIGIVGGSYSTGDPTLTLKVGSPVTLQNTSDAQRYKLVLLSTP